MKLNEFISENNFWIGIRDISSDPVKTFIDEVSAEMLKIMMSVEYGEKEMFKPFTVIHQDDFCELISSKFDDKWSKLISADLYSLDILSDNVEFENKTGSNTTNVVRNDLVKNQTTGYNSDDLIVEGGSDNSHNGNDTTNYTEEITRGNKSILSAIENLNVAQKNYILNVAIKDVAKYITLSIY